MLDRACRVACALLRRLMGALIASAALVTSGGVAAADPAMPQVTVGYIFAPSPLVQFHRYRLVYEMLLTNYMVKPYQLDQIDALGGAKRFSYSGVALKNMMKVVGAAGMVGTDTTIAAGATIEVFFTLTFDERSQIPQHIIHRLHFASADGTRHTVTAPPLIVDRRAPVIVAPPLRGTNWIAGDASHNGTPFDRLDGPVDAAHRRATLVSAGRVFLAQRYAIDWVKVKMLDGRAVTHIGRNDRNESYFCYGDEIHSVAAGRVVGIPDNIPLEPAIIPITLETAGGNHVVVDIGGGRYALYAHMKRGSLPSTLKIGSHVTTGQVLGLVGNSGNSTEPHLHFHMTDAPSFLTANGIPYELTTFLASRSATFHEQPNGIMEFTGIGPLQRMVDDYPENNAAVDF